MFKAYLAIFIHIHCFLKSVGCGRYNSAFFICCGGVLRQQTGLGQACCGTHTYDSRFFICCGGVVRQLTGLGQACCGTHAYDSRFQKCCNGRVQTSCGGYGKWYKLWCNFCQSINHLLQGLKFWLLVFTCTLMTVLIYLICCNERSITSLYITTWVYDSKVQRVLEWEAKLLYCAH